MRDIDNNLDEKLDSSIRFKTLKTRAKNLYCVDEEQLVKTILHTFNILEMLGLPVIERCKIVEECDGSYIKYSINIKDICRINIEKSIREAFNLKSLNSKLTNEYAKEVMRFCFNESCFLFDEIKALLYKEILVYNWNYYYGSFCKLLWR